MHAARFPSPKASQRSETLPRVLCARSKLHSLHGKAIGNRNKYNGAKREEGSVMYTVGGGEEGGGGKLRHSRAAGHVHFIVGQAPWGMIRPHCCVCGTHMLFPFRLASRPIYQYPRFSKAPGWASAVPSRRTSTIW